MAKKYIVTLTEEERRYLHQMLSAGAERARKLTRARILLKADEGWTDEAIHQALDISISTASPLIGRVCRRFVEEGLEAALIAVLPHASMSGSSMARPKPFG